jgi:hypothetical protein
MAVQAMELLSSMCMFEEAKRLAEQAASQGPRVPGGRAVLSGGGAAAVAAELIGRQAEWSEQTANYEAAAEMYIKASAGTNCQVRR